MQRLGLQEDMQYEGPMYNRHISTILGGWRLPRRVHYHRELLDGEDGNPICIDWLHCRREPSASPQKGASELPQGLLVVMPGAGNTSQTPYIQRLARLSVSRGYDCCILTSRGLGSAPLQVPQFASINFTKDLRVLLRQRLSKERIFKDYGKELPLFVVGYSAGGNTVIKCIAEEQALIEQLYPSRFPVTGCICMNSPYDLKASSTAMNSGFGLLFYQQAIISAFKRVFKKHRKLIEQALPVMSIKESNIDKLIRSLNSLDDVEQLITVPHFGYKDQAHYYNDAYAPKWIRQIKNLPIVAVASRDDPVSAYGVTAGNWQEIADAQPNIVYVETPVGGHLSYLLGPLDEWHERPSFLIDFPLRVMDHYIASAQDSTSK
ncbi:unnamed protein product [Phytomonas sp. EM1]|nr:unnamed protein product [Phytomonas sp. EM1]|eukprot:CCW64772.1 unnamed protein product [Phytomonas sp. isolate EM1]